MSYLPELGTPIRDFRSMELTPEQEQALRNVSESHLEFVRYALSRPAFLTKASYKALHTPDCMSRDPVQSWPTLVDPPLRAELESASVGICRLIKSIPEIVFEFDAQSISEFYRLDLSFIKHFVLGALREQNISGAIGRGDFIKGHEGLWCIEFNIASNLGGLWEALAWEKKIKSLPLIADYLRKNGMRTQVTNSFRLMMRHFVNEVIRFGLPASGPINVAYVLNKTRAELDSEDSKMGKYLADDYRELMHEFTPKMEGELFPCAFDDLNIIDGQLYFAGAPVHLVVECMGGDVPLHVLRCQQRNQLSVYNGPISYLLCNKLNLAVLSELQDSGIFADEDQELIRRHIPWTRKLEAGEVDFHGRKVVLPAFLFENRQNLVLKKSISRSGHDVVVGRYGDLAEWTREIDRAVQEQDWIVQEFIACPPLVYQHGEYGSCPHDVVWGLFVFGDTYGGAFLRMLPKTSKSAVNATLGSSDGIVLELL